MKETKRDSGYSWVILCVAFNNNLLVGGNFNSPSVYMVDWVQAFETTKAEVGFVASLYGGVACVVGLAVGPLVKTFGCKIVSIVGTLFMTAGVFLSIFATSIWWLYITFGVLAGIGHGLVFLPPLLMVQCYFDKKRPLAAGISQIGHSVGVFVMIPLLRIFVQIFGWRGALLLHTGFIMQMLAFALLYRMPNIPEMQNQIQRNKKELDETSSKRSIIGNYCKEIFDFSVLKNKVYIQYLIALLLAQFSLDLVYRFTSLKAVSNGMDKVTASLLPSIISIASACARIFVSFIANLPCVNRTIFCGIAIFFQGVFAEATCFEWNLSSLLVFLAFFGIFTGTSQTLVFTVLTDVVGVGNLAYGQSFLSGFLLIPMISAITLAGMMADKTNNYDLPYYIYGSLQMVGGMLVMIIPLMQRRQEKPEFQNKNGTSTTESPLPSGQDLRRTVLRTQLSNTSDNMFYTSLNSLSSMPG